MIKRKDGQQLEIVCMDLGELIPENHLLKQISEKVSFEFIYDKVEHLYSDKGRPGIDPVVLMKMLIVGYLYGIKSERRLEEEVKLNIAYRWFCGLGLSDKIPDHSTFSQNRRRRFNDSTIFNEIFNEIVIQCISNDLVTGDDVVSDGTYIPANVSKKSKLIVTQQVEKSTVSYMEALNKELSQMNGYKEPVPRIIKKEVYKSTTDHDCGYIAQPNKKGLGYLAEMSVDTTHGIITGVDVFPANTSESTIILKHIERQIADTGISIKNLALDGGYDSGAVHRGLEILNIKGYSSLRNYHNNPMKKGFEYNVVKDCFVCKCGKELHFHRIAYKRTTQNYHRQYKIARKECNNCPHIEQCAVDKSAVRINASAYYPSFYANIKRTETSEYKRLKRLRSIWAEGTFAALKREHKLSRTCKRGNSQVNEECLLAAIALNLKRIVKATNFHFFRFKKLLPYLRIIK
jgi:transposase